MLGERPLLARSFILMLRKGKGGWVVDSLRKALLLLEEVHFWEQITDEDIVLNLKWHSIVVSVYPQPLSDKLTYVCPYCLSNKGAIW